MEVSDEGDFQRQDVMHYTVKYCGQEEEGDERRDNESDSQAMQSSVIPIA
jgi:hypothetical protein